MGNAPIGFRYEDPEHYTGRLVLDGLGKIGAGMVPSDFNDVARQLNISRTRAWRLLRNLRAYNAGNLDAVLWAGSAASRGKTARIEAAKQAARSEMKAWLVEIAPDAEFEWT